MYNKDAIILINKSITAFICTTNYVKDEIVFEMSAMNRLLN